MEIADVYDSQRKLTGKVHRRGQRLPKGEYVTVVCVWVSDGRGHILLTLRAPQKAASPNTWENSGGGVQAGETSLQAIVRELREETGICEEESHFRLLETDQSRDTFFDFYFLEHPVDLREIVLQPGETVDAKWVTLDEMDEMIAKGVVAQPISKRFRRHRKILEKLVGKPTE